MQIGLVNSIGAACKVNCSPTDIAISNSSINERAGSNAVVGTLSTVDGDPADTFTYSLVSGTGSTDNSLFNISGTSLRATSSLNYADAATRSVRVRSTDAAGASVEEAFTITVNYVNAAPVNTVPGAQSVAAGATLVFSSGAGNAITVSDVESLTVTLSAASGTLTLSGTSGLSFTAGDGTADATMTFSGTTASVNAALSGLTYTPPAPAISATSDTITILTSDGSLSDSDTIAVAITYRLLDTFTDANGTLLASHTPEQGGPWTAQFGAFSISSNRAYVSTVFGAGTSACVDSGAANYSVEGVCRAAASGSTGAVAVRMQSGGQQRIFAQVETSNQKFRLYRYNGSSHTQLGSVDGVFAVNTDYRIKIVCSGSSIIATCDGAKQISVTDTQQQSSQLVGLRGDSTNCQVSEILAW